MEICAVSTTAENNLAATGKNEHGAAGQPTPNGAAMFSGAPANVPAGGQKPATEQLNLRIRADLYRQLDRVSVILGARRGVPVNRVTVIEEALAAYFEANRTTS
jgi:hypothetical protein